MTVAVRPDESDRAWSAQSLYLEEGTGRTCYPVFTEGAVRRVLGRVLGVDGADRPGELSVLFLFKGDQPLKLTLTTPGTQELVLNPIRASTPRLYDRLLLRWWREYHARARQQEDSSDYPPLVETYLTSMLSRRLGLAPPLLSRIENRSLTEPYETLQLVTGVESLRLDMLKRSNLGELNGDRSASIPLPPEIPWSPAPPLDIAPDVEIEAMATRVPEECFYVRFGTFENYLWLERLQKDYGGDIGRMVTLRGYDAGLSQRVQQQLALRTSVLAEFVGPRILADVALIGRDLYLREGAALGLLFQASNSSIFASDLARQRSAALEEQRDAGASEVKVTIGGREVSLLSTPDNRLRSYYVADGDFHLVTTSRAIVERFIEVCEGRGRGSLSESAEFRHARTVMPTSREDTIFVYFGTSFLQGLLSPQYQVELARRLRAATDLELMLMATWAAFGERQPHGSIPELVRGGFLPTGFGQRPDGSKPIISGDTVADSLRGGRGSFTPVPDVKITGITREEADRLARQAAFYGESWKRMDPLMVGIKRYALDGPDMERIVIDAHVSPFVQDKYGWMTSLIGPPTPLRIRPADGDVITAQVVLRGGLLSPQVPVHHLFVGIQDHAPLSDMAPRGLLGYLSLLRTTPGYLGAWPKPGFLDWLPLGLGGGPPDAQGYSRLLLGVWRRQWQDFSALAFDPELLSRVTPQLIPEETDKAAQIRVHVSDLTGTKLSEWVDNLAYGRAYLASLGNARLLHAMSQQLGVPRRDALRAAEHLLDARLVCSLGGEYEWDDSRGMWTSSAWPQDDPERRPPDYEAPLLEWFRGLDGDLIMDEDHVVVNATLDIQRKPSERPTFQLPRFNLFGGAKKKTTPEPELEEVPPRPAP
ncbi:MAG: hypothetical protein JJ992_02630 [Planctomycetes bacterium]|nr:hypothetical protein [Planctomycetota bacterium]